MFDCKVKNCSGVSCLECIQNISRKGGQSFGLPLEIDRATMILGAEVHQFYEPLVCDLSKIARQRIEKMKLFLTQTCSSIRVQRLEITRFLRLLLGSAKNMKGDISYESVSTILYVLPELIDPLRRYGWNSAWDKEFFGYEIYHGVLEWRWLLMLLIKEVKEPVEPTDIDQIIGVGERKLTKSFGTIYRELMVDMLNLSFHHFRLYTIENVSANVPYACICVKHLWLGMMVLADTEKLDFWNCLNECMPPAVKQNKDAYIFKIWQINALAKLYEQKSKLTDETPLLTLPNSSTVIDELLKDFLKSNTRELPARVFMILLQPIVTVLWPARIETVIALWDYFSVRLNAAFHTSSDSLETMGCVSSSVHGFIEQAASLAAVESINENFNSQRSSLQMFLTLLSWIIRHYTKQGLKKKVQIIFNRIFLKLGPKKFENMTEQAIYNLGLTLLTMVSATSFDTDYSRVSKVIQMVPLTNEAMKLPINLVIKRIKVTTQAHMAILVLFSSSSFDKTTHIVTYLDSIKAAFHKYGDRLLPVMEIIAEGMYLIYSKAIVQESFDRGEISLLGSWILKYLRYSSSDRRQKLLNVIMDSLNCKRSSLSEEYYSAMNQHVMPFVKEKFSYKAVAPPSIGRIAARMTIHNESTNTDKDNISSFFNTYIDCPEACPDQVLVYLKEILQCPKTIPSIGQTVIIQQWLKMGILFDRDSLLEVTRVVHGLDEFQALCEIPEYDMLESNEIPIKLFFQFVGKRYHESNTVVQNEMKMKLHSIFEEFDKWFSAPKGIIRRRILAVLVLALKECPKAFYIKNKLNCLYAIAFQQFFLPFFVLVDRNVEDDFIEDIAKIWHKVMDVLGNMDYKNDPIIGDNVCNMLNKWILQFAKLSNQNNALKPLMLFFCARNEDLVLFAMNRFVMTYVELTRCLPKPNAVQVMTILRNLIKSLVKQKDYSKISLFIRTTGLSITQHAFMCNEKFPTRAIAMEMLLDLMISTDAPSNLIKEAMRNVLISFTLKYFPLSAECYLKFMCRLVDPHPNFIRSFIDFIRCEESEGEITCAQKMDSVLSKAANLLERKLNTRQKTNNIVK